MLNVSVVIKCTIYKFERVTRESRLVVASQGFKIQFPSFHVQYNLSHCWKSSDTTEVDGT